MNQVGKVSHLFSICLQLANEAAKIIHSIQTGGLKAEQWKGKDDPMTIADIKAQTLIIKGIRKHYPSITIVGEEQIEFEGDLGYDVNNLNPNLIPEQYFNTPKIQNSFNIDDVVVWIDPLDGTLSYVKEEYDAVTTLIGVSIHNRPLMGIISQPYRLEKNGTYTFKPKIYFGHVDSSQVFYAYGEELDEEGRKSYLPYEFRLQNANRPLDKLIGATSKHRVKEHVLNFIKNDLNPAILLQNGGSGKKSLQVLENEVDFCTHLSSKASRWDTVACEALLQIYGGQITDIYGNRYDYDSKLTNYYNINGGVYTLRPDVHQYLINKTKNFKLNEE
ncbi:hypothetical protein ABPG74_011763 [Tetrahymena malaccensis]